MSCSQPSVNSHASPLWSVRALPHDKVKVLLYLKPTLFKQHTHTPLQAPGLGQTQEPSHKHDQGCSEPFLKDDQTRLVEIGRQFPVCFFIALMSALVSKGLRSNQATKPQKQNHLTGKTKCSGNL